MVITTNHKTDGLYLPTDDRRHYVAWSDATREQFTPDYWTNLYRWYATGGAGHVAAHLQWVGYVPVRNPDADDGLFKVSGKRQAIYDAAKNLDLAAQIRAARLVR